MLQALHRSTASWHFSIDDPRLVLPLTSGLSPQTSFSSFSWSDWISVSLEQLHPVILEQAGRCMSSLQSLERWSRSGGIAPWRLKDPSWLARPNFCEAFISYHLPWGLGRWDISFWIVHIRIRIYKWNKMKKVKRTPHMSAFSHCSLNMLKQTIFACWVTPGGPTKNINISKSNCDQILSWLHVMVSNVSSHPSPGCTFGWSSGFRSAHGSPRSPRWCFTTV